MLISIGKRLNMLHSVRSWNGRQQYPGTIKFRMFNNDRLIATIDSWITYLDEYTINQLHANPAPGNWSIGQLYVHLIVIQIIISKRQDWHRHLTNMQQGNLLQKQGRCFERMHSLILKLKVILQMHLFPIRRIIMN